ncbi:MAG: choice-of-anchor L domain-containing protein [Thermomicrobiales bacterium]
MRQSSSAFRNIVPIVLGLGLVLGGMSPALDAFAKGHPQRHAQSRSVASEARSRESLAVAKKEVRSRRGSSRAAGDPLVVQQRLAQAAADTLLGSGVAISNVQFTGAPAALGTFATGDANLIGFHNGVVLSSGFISNVVGPNVESGISGENEAAGDADLDALLDPGDDPTEDAAVLEFDFVPDTSKVSFRYVFASEEYLEFVDAGFNDVFGFFINGENCAVVNGDAVSVDSINPDRNAEYYRDNEAGSLQTEMDGLTTVLTCGADVSAGQTNHLKLAIADVGDSIYDTNVFIRAGSFSSGEPAPPDCTNAVASPAQLSAVLPKKPKKGKKKKPVSAFADVFVQGVTDPNGDDPTITITGILQDEAVGSKADASGIGSDRARVRREANPKGDGRIYRIGFTAEDGQGDTCAGSVDVGVKLKGQTPHGNPTIDSTRPS